MSRLIRKRILVAKLEVTSGTPEALTNADGAFIVFNPKITADIPKIDRPASGSLSKMTSTFGARSGKITFETELAGSGSAQAPTPAWASTFLPACGFEFDAGTNTFSPTSDPTKRETITIGIFEDGLFKSIAGAVGTVEIEGEYGKSGTIKFEFTGKWVEPVDATISLPTFPTVIAPRFAGASFTLGGDPLAISKFSLKSNGTTKLIEDITDVTGYSFGIITDRDIAGQIDPEGKLVSENDFYGDWIAGTSQAMELELVGADNTGNHIIISAPATQYVNVQEGDRDKLEIESIDFECHAGSNTGDDELTIQFTTGS